MNGLRSFRKMGDAKRGPPVTGGVDQPTCLRWKREKGPLKNQHGPVHCDVTRLAPQAAAVLVT